MGTRHRNRYRKQLQQFPIDFLDGLEIVLKINEPRVDALQVHEGSKTTSRTHLSLEKDSPEPRLLTPPRHGRAIAIP